MWPSGAVRTVLSLSYRVEILPNCMSSLVVQKSSIGAAMGGATSELHADVSSGGPGQIFGLHPHPYL